MYLRPLTTDRRRRQVLSTISFSVRRERASGHIKFVARGSNPRVSVNSSNTVLEWGTTESGSRLPNANRRCQTIEQNWTYVGGRESSGRAIGTRSVGRGSLGECGQARFC